MNETKETCPIFTVQPISFAMAYVPLQSWEKTYDASVALERGTLFSQLDKPFLGKEAFEK